jgi:hypothetical protein
VGGFSTILNGEKSFFFFLFFPAIKLYTGWYVHLCARAHGHAKPQVEQVGFLEKSAEPSFLTSRRRRKTFTFILFKIDNINFTRFAADKNHHVHLNVHSYILNIVV